MQEKNRKMQEEDDLIKIQKSHLEYALSQEDEIISNHTYKYEQELLEYIKSGNVEQVLKNQKQKIFPEYPQLMSFSDKKNEEYMAVISVALAARAAIQAGITSTESFQMSDLYLKRISFAQDIETVRKIRDEAILAYTELVCRRKQDGKAGRYVEDCKQFVASHIFKKISVKDAAEALNLNAVYLERIFKESEGVTIGQYIQHEKIERAKNLLIYSDRSIMEIGEYLGFSSQSHFGQVFKREVGMTPRKFQTINNISGF
jgi:AraC-like DNA-binding protein